MSSSLTLAELAKQFKGIDKGFDIKKIVLEDSNVRDIESLEPFTSLEYISFRCNNLDSIEFLINNYYLRHINLSNNKLNLLDVRITQLSKLEYINLANNNLDDISPLNDCTNLKVIVANNNKITKFPRISKLESLEILILSDNLIESVGLPSAHNKKLAKVSLSRNKIREFPLTKFWPSLKELRLNGNKIITLPSKDQLDVMSSIRTLDLGNNSIYDKSYALNLKAFVNLRDLNLLGNPVSDKITIEELELERLIIYNSRKIAKRDAGNNDRKTAKTLCKIPNRSYIRLNGSDTEHFLQGITTNNLTKLIQETPIANKYPAISSLFLTPHGKIVADCFIIKMQSGYLIDVGNRSYQDLIDLFKRRKLSSNVSITPIIRNIYQFLPPLIATTSPNEQKITTTNDLFPQISNEYYQDPRHWKLGLRILSQNDDIQGIERENYDFENHNFYKILLRYLELIEDVGYAYGKRLVPQDINLDNELYISRTKGCYTGQEIVNKLRNGILFPRYQLIAGVGFDSRLKDADVDQMLKNLGVNTHIQRDILLALISYINNDGQIPQDYCMKLIQRS